MSISFIIPAYNSDRTLSKCLDSILRQPYDDYEIIVIDDGSTDKTERIIQDYKDLDKRVIGLHQENAGQGAARAKGLEQARGEFVWFVDSDDWLLPNVLPRLSKLLSKEKPDVLVTNFEFAFDDQNPAPSSLVPSHLAGKTICPSENAGNFAAVSCWNTPPWRLISRRTHLLNHNINFATGVFYEDHPFAIHLMLTAQRVYIDPSITYSYYQRANSTTKINDHKALDFLQIRKMCLELFNRYGQYESLAQIVVGYLFPANFYNAHVSEEYKNVFIQKLHDDLQEEDYIFAEQHGDWTVRLFAKAVRAKDASVITQVLVYERIKAKYSRQGARRLISRAKNALIRIALRKAMLLRHLALNTSRHVGVDTSGRRFLSAGAGTRIEHIYVDVRLAIENRTYVKIGSNSHISGTYVFERGIGSITIGDKSSIGSGCKFICSQDQGIHIGSNVMLSWDCTLMDTNAHSLDPEVRANDAYDWKAGVDAGRIGAYKDWSQVKSDPIYIEDNVWIGFECAILKGVRIGRGSVIGARSMVTRDVAPFCVYAGSPARFVSYVPRERWSWEEIIHAAQGNPEMDSILQDAYLHKDLMGSLKRYMATDEFKETIAEFKNVVPEAKSIIDIGGAGGVMSLAFALSGYDVTLAEPSSDTIVGTSAAQYLVDLVAENIDSSIRERVSIKQCPIEFLETTQRFDIVYCRQVVHHFPDPAFALKKINSLLNNKGAAFFVREHVIFDDADMDFFLKNHPFHKYTGGENAYRSEQYRQFIVDAEMILVKEYRFADSPINYFPHSEDVVAKYAESEIGGRPYTYIAKKKKSG